MPLAHDLSQHRDMILSDLDAAHDFYAHTRQAWAIVQTQIGLGRRVSMRNRATGSRVSNDELAHRARNYVAEQLAAASFQQFVSLFEDFMFGVVRLWLGAFPHSLGNRQMTFQDAISAGDLEGITREIIEREIRSISYRRVRDWFSSLETLVKLGCPSEADIQYLAEIKASRDILVHNRSIVNKTYTEKAGTMSRFSFGERLTIPEQYHQESWMLIRKVVTEVAGAAIAKAG